MSALQRSTQPVVIDIGASLTKCGFAGEALPRSVFNTPTNVFAVRARTISEWRHVLSPLLRTIFLSVLQVNIRDRKVIICESIDFPTAAKKAIMQLFRSPQYQVPAMLFLPSPSLISLCVAPSSILLIDIGEEFTNILPVVDNTPIVASNKFMPFGVRSVKSHLKAELIDYYKRHENERIFSENKLNALTIAELSDRLQRPDLPDEVQSRLLDILFGENEERVNLSELILLCLLASDIHIRKQCCAHLVISSGGAYLSQLPSRILKELQQLTDTQYTQFSGIRDSFSFVSVPLFAPNLMAWAGGSIMGSINLNENEWIIRENLNTF